MKPELKFCCLVERTWLWWRDEFQRQQTTNKLRFQHKKQERKIKLNEVWFNFDWIAATIHSFHFSFMPRENWAAGKIAVWCRKLQAASFFLQPTYFTLSRLNSNFFSISFSEEEKRNERNWMAGGGRKLITEEEWMRRAGNSVSFPANFRLNFQKAANLTETERKPAWIRKKLIFGSAAPFSHSLLISELLRS